MCGWIHVVSRFVIFRHWYNRDRIPCRFGKHASSNWGRLWQVVEMPYPNRQHNGSISICGQRNKSQPVISNKYNWSINLRLFLPFKSKELVIRPFFNLLKYKYIDLSLDYFLHQLLKFQSFFSKCDLCVDLLESVRFASVNNWLMDSQELNLLASNLSNFLGKSSNTQSINNHAPSGSNMNMHYTLTQRQMPDSNMTMQNSQGSIFKMFLHFIAVSLSYFSPKSEFNFCESFCLWEVFVS